MQRSKPSPPPLSSIPLLHFSHPHCGRIKKKQEKREKKRILPRFSLVMSRPRAPLAPVYVSRSRCLNGLVSSLSLSRPSRIPVSHPPRRCPDFSEVLRSASAVRLSSPFRHPPSLLRSVTSFSTSKRCEYPGAPGSWGPPSCESCFCDGVFFAIS